jgi:hypothetical protein
MSTDILPFLQEASFDSQATCIMGEAFDIARKNMHDSGQPKMVLEIIAKRIIAIMSNGERNPARIAELALAAIGLECVSEGSFSE